MTDWLKESLEIESELIDLRRTLHRHPELPLHEVKTHRWLRNRLCDGPVVWRGSQANLWPAERGRAGTDSEWGLEALWSGTSG